MKTSVLFKTTVFLLTSLFVTACIETEIVPETLDPVLTLTPKSTVLNVGDMMQLQATYTDPSNIDRSDLIDWQSNNASVASVNGNGLVSALAAGQSWIVARVPGALADSTLITVIDNSNAVASVVINAPATSVEVDANLQFLVTVLNGDGEEIPEQMVTWQSADPTVLSINENGLATGVSEGITQITATAGGVSSVPFTVEVTPAGGAMRTGSFQGNMSYNVRGTVTLADVNGNLQVAFADNFQSSNGPGLRVYLATNAPMVLTAQNSVKLGDLKNTRGAQTYEVPSSVSIDQYDFVVIYCEPFNVAFGFARLN